jgi:hypothetical protein
MRVLKKWQWLLEPNQRRYLIHQLKQLPLLPFRYFL